MTSRPDAARPATSKVLAAALALVLAALAAAAIASPSATVTIGDRTTIATRASIPFRDLGVQHAERSARPEPTGVADPASARGEVYFLCCGLPTGFACFFGCSRSDEPPARSIPAGTIVLDRQTDLRFRTLAAATIDERHEQICDDAFLAGTCWLRSGAIPAIALAPGRDGNGTLVRPVAPSARTIQGVRVTVRTATAFAGGLDGNEAVLTRDDVRTTANQVQEQARTTLRRNAAAIGRARRLTTILIGERTAVADGAATKQVGETFIGATFGTGHAHQVVARSRARVVGYREAALRRAAERALAQVTPEGRSIARGSTRTAEPEIRGDRLLFRVRASLTLDGRDAIPSFVAGRSPAAAIAALKHRYGVREVRIDRGGFPWPRMPLLSSRIRVVVESA